jgi:hypothetical protein
MTSAEINSKCSTIRVVEVSPRTYQTVNDTLSISSSEACFMDWKKCKVDKRKPKGYDINRQCATPCQFVIPANMSAATLKMYRMPYELGLTSESRKTLPLSFDKKLFLEPSMPFKLGFNGATYDIRQMVLYHPCPVRIENVQYDAVLQLGEANATGGDNDLIVLIPLAASGSPKGEGVTLFQKIAPFIGGLADTASGDTTVTGGTTLDTSPAKSSRCEAIQKARDRRWNISIAGSLDKYKREVIRIAREEGNSKMFNHPSGPRGGSGQVERWVRNSAPSRFPEYFQELLKKEGPSFIWKDDAYLWDAFEYAKHGETWKGRYDRGWDKASQLIDKIRNETDKQAERLGAADQRAAKKQEEEFLRMVESGVPDPNEPLTPCEIFNVAVGQDWSLTKLIPVGGASIVSGAYYSWQSAKVRYKPQTGKANEACVVNFGLEPIRGKFTQYVVMEKPVYISSSDLRSIRSLPPVPPEEAGVRFVETNAISYRNAVPDNCVTCKQTAEDAAQLQQQMKQGKVDKKLLAKVVFSILGSLAMFIGIYLGLRWAMGPKGEILKNIGSRVGTAIGNAIRGQSQTLPSLPKKGTFTVVPSKPEPFKSIVP